MTYIPIWTLKEYFDRTEECETTALSAGAYGQTHLVSGLDLKWVVKLLDKFEEKSFRREARILSKLMGVEGVQQLEGTCLEAEQFMLVTRYAGYPLSTCCRLQLLSAGQVEEVLQQLGDIVRRLHSCEIAHNDLHRSNVCVLVGETRVLVSVIDFGLATYKRSEFCAERDLESLAKTEDFLRNVYSPKGEEKAEEIFEGKATTPEVEEEEDIDWFDKFSG